MTQYRTSLVLRNDIADLSKATAALTSLCLRSNVDETTATDMNLALEELFTNVVRHGYEDSELHEINVEFNRQGDALIVRLADDGKHFDPSGAPQVDMRSSAAFRPVGGLGIHLVKRLTDTLEYRREDGRNIVTVTKKIASP